MTAFTPNPRQPGERLVKLATFLFDEPTRSTFVIPALADFQQELREAGESPVKRLTAHVRGYAAFARLVVAAPFIVPSAPMGSPVTTFVMGKHGGNLLLVLALALFAAIRPLFGWFAVAVIGLGVALAITLRVWNNRHPDARTTADPLLSILAVALFASIWSMFGWFVLAAVGGGVIMAIALRRWNTRHPSELAPASARTPGAEINLSSIPVAGDFGGLLFVIGAIVTVLLGLPDIRWFVLASVVVGAVLAGGLFVWRSSHTSSLSPDNTILTR
jgi:MFS family permease